MASHDHSFSFLPHPRPTGHTPSSISPYNHNSFDTPYRSLISTNSPYNIGPFTTPFSFTTNQ